MSIDSDCTEIHGKSCRLTGTKCNKNQCHADYCGDGPNYIINFNALGVKPIECETIEEVYEHLSKRSFGLGYWVESPTGLDVSEFIPF